MKKLIYSLIIGLVSLNVYAAETKKVCIDTKGKDGKVIIDNKTGKAKQTCKVMKEHKKLEGTKVPEKK